MRRHITSFSGLGRTGFVKRNVTVLADTAEEEFDTAVRLDDSLICIAFRDEVGCIAIENMYLRGGYVNWRRVRVASVDDNRGRTNCAKRTPGT